MKISKCIRSLTKDTDRQKALDAFIDEKIGNVTYEEVQKVLIIKRKVKNK